MTPLKTLSYASGRPEIVEGNEMKSVEDCLEDIQDSVYEKFPYTVSLIQYADEDVLESRLKSISQASELRDHHSLRLFAEGLATMLDDAMLDRARAMSQASVTPLDNDTNESDLKREM